MSRSGSCCVQNLCCCFSSSRTYVVHCLVRRSFVCNRLHLVELNSHAMNKFRNHSAVWSVLTTTFNKKSDVQNIIDARTKHLPRETVVSEFCLLDFEVLVERQFNSSTVAILVSVANVRDCIETDSISNTNAKSGEPFSSQ